MAQEKRLTTLEHAVRPRVLARYGGQLALTVAALTTVPLVAALIGGALTSAIALAVTVLLLALGGWMAQRIEAPTEIQPNEALVLAAGAFLLTPVAMIWPLSAYGLAPLDAWFEAVSAVTTTGLSTIKAPERQPDSISGTSCSISFSRKIFSVLDITTTGVLFFISTLLMTAFTISPFR